MYPSDLDEDYVRKNARPGEEWDHARSRLGGEVARRYCKLPVCEICAAGTNSFQLAVERHSLGMCSASLSEWPAAAMSQRLFDAAHEQSETHTRAQEAIARGNIQSRLHHIQVQTHPINALRLACAAGGYIEACDELGLFDPGELNRWRQQVYMAHQKAEADFVRQFHQRDPDALPWRSAKQADEQ
jgi:hypothetical protein